MRQIEQQVLQRALAGDEEAYALVVEVYQTPVYNLCYRMLGESGEAEDAAQETFWRAYQALNRYDRQRPFGTWLLSIAAHFCIDQQRKRRLHTFELDEVAEETLPDPTPNPEKVIGQLEQERALHQLLAGLNSQDRAVLVLRYWYEFSEEEISQSLSLTVSAVKSRLHRARLLLAQRYQAAQPQTVVGRNHYGSPAF
ncbi:MAG TPA: sigma-70 family RNA polymerase sigma factor [Anaerolineaceae bacterium]|nr:sigma-70 family RNA polymerase sigma factor [Anaerolineaceae bacterium]